MTEEKFYRLTPRQLNHLVRRKRETAEYRQDHLELMTGIIASTIANYAGKVGKGPLAPSDFMPGLRAKQRKREREMPKEVIAQNIRNFLMSQMETMNGGKKPGERWTEPF